MEQSRKLTAVEYLGFQINLNPTTIHKNENTNDWTITIKMNELNKIYKHSKELEKEQIVTAFDIACEDSDRIGLEYYDDTFGKNS